MNIRTRKLLTSAAVLVVAGLVVAVVFLSGGIGSGESAGGLWTCSMHPQIRLNHPGKCPICGMDLVPVQITTPAPTASPTGSAHPGTHLFLDEHARAMARVESVEIRSRPLTKEIISAGKVEFDESTLAAITARIEGRVDEVQASFPGTNVKEGDHLVSIYSPDLLVTQNQLLASHQRSKVAGGDISEALASAARQRLELWGVTPRQIDDLLTSGKPSTHLTIFAPRGGTIIKKNIQPGQYVRVGDALYSIADLSHVWLIVNVYESEIPWVRFGQSVDIKLEQQPGQSLRGSVGFIEPVLDDASRTVRVRIVLSNPDGLLKPGMYAQATIRVPIMPDGTPAPTGLEGKYACPMHPYIVSDQPGNCSICKMPLELVPGKPRAPGSGPPEVPAVPVSAVLTTGLRQLVYVETEPGMYHVAQPKLGPRAGDYYPVLAGLSPGDRVVFRGNFLLDSQFQITGNPSLLYPEGISGGGTGHGHGGHGTSPSTAPAPSRPEGHSGHGSHAEHKAESVEKPK